MNECVFCMFNNNDELNNYELAMKMLKLNIISITAIALLCEQHFILFMKYRKEMMNL